MTTINGRACVANGTQVDKVFSNGKQVYGRNLIGKSGLRPGYTDRKFGNMVSNNERDFCLNNYIATNGATVFTFSSPDYAFKGNNNNTLAMYDSDKNFLDWQPITYPTQTLSKSNATYIRFSINFVVEGGTSGNLSDWLGTHRYKLEKGSVPTPWTPAPEDVM